MIVDVDEPLGPGFFIFFKPEEEFKHQTPIGGENDDGSKLKRKRENEVIEILSTLIHTLR